jgi:5'-3' exonuclease
MGVKGLSGLLRAKHPSLFSKPCDLSNYAGQRFAVDVSIYLHQFAYGKDPGDDRVFLQKFVTQYRLFQSYGIAAVYIFDGHGARDDKECERKKRALKTKRTSELRNIKIDGLTAQLIGPAAVETQTPLSGDEGPGLEVDVPVVLEGVVPVRVEDRDVDLQDPHAHAESAASSTGVPGGVDDPTGASVPRSNLKRNSELLYKIARLELFVINVRPIHYANLKVIFRELDIPYYDAVGEAEKACAWLACHRFVDVVVTNDYDAVVCGAGRVLFNLGSVTSPLVELNLDAILFALQLTYLQFVDFCILCGTDFNCSLPRIGPVTALSKIRTYGSIENLLRRDPKLILTPEVVADFSYEVARVRFLDNSFPLTSEFAAVGAEPVARATTSPAVTRAYDDTPRSRYYSLKAILNPE